jgi:hypothetical protein
MKVVITYFKPSGKYYCQDEDAEWPEDPTHFTKWAPFEAVARIKGMIAVCMESPLGYPQFVYPQEAPALRDVITNAIRTTRDGGPIKEPLTCEECHGTRAIPTRGPLEKCPGCQGLGIVERSQQELDEAASPS